MQHSDFGFANSSALSFVVNHMAVTQANNPSRRIHHQWVMG